VLNVLRGALDQLALKAQDVADGDVDDAVDEAMNPAINRGARASLETDRPNDSIAEFRLLRLRSAN